MMPIFKITTEGDCEGRTTKLLGYVEARDAEHAIKHMKHVGKDEYYKYEISEERNLVVTATPEVELDYLEADIKQNPLGYGSRYWTGTVKTKESVLQEKRKKVADLLAASGLTVEEIVKFGAEKYDN